MSQENVEAFKRFIDGFNRRDAEAMLEAVDAEVVTKVDNTNFQEATAFHKGSYASGNLLWMPADRILAGIEFLWGKREDNDGNSGTDFRMQSSFKISFSSKDIWD